MDYFIINRFPDQVVLVPFLYHGFYQALLTDLQDDEPYFSPLSNGECNYNFLWHLSYFIGYIILSR